MSKFDKAPQLLHGDDVVLDRTQPSSPLGSSIRRSEPAAETGAGGSVGVENLILQALHLLQGNLSVELLADQACVFIGSLNVEGRPEGQGVATNRSAQREERNEYRGEFQGGTRYGIGEVKFGDGTTYQGEWVLDHPKGYGMEVYPDGGVYKGRFWNDSRHGLGAYYFANGQRYFGKWHAGVRHGEGVEMSKNQDKFLSVFEMGKRVSKVDLREKRSECMELLSQVDAVAQVGEHRAQMAREASSKLEILSKLLNTTSGRDTTVDKLTELIADVQLRQRDSAAPPTLKNEDFFEDEDAVFKKIFFEGETRAKRVQEIEKELVIVASAMTKLSEWSNEAKTNFKAEYTDQMLSLRSQVEALQIELNELNRTEPASDKADESDKAEEDKEVWKNRKSSRPSRPGTQEGSFERVVVQVSDEVLGERPSAGRKVQFDQTVRSPLAAASNSAMGTVPVDWVERPQGGVVVSNFLGKGLVNDSGIMIGDVLVDVDGQTVKDLNYDVIVPLLYGPSGSRVRLTMLRGDEPIRLMVERKSLAVLRPDLSHERSRPSTAGSEKSVLSEMSEETPQNDAKDTQQKTGIASAAVVGKQNKGFVMMNPAAGSIKWTMHQSPRRVAEQERKAQELEQLRLAAEERKKREAEEVARREEEELNRLALQEARARAAAELKKKGEDEAAARAKREAERREKEMAEARARLEAEEAARKVDEEIQALRAEEARIRSEEAAARKLAEQERLQAELMAIEKARRERIERERIRMEEDRKRADAALMEGLNAARSLDVAAAKRLLDEAIQITKLGHMPTHRREEIFQLRIDTEFAQIKVIEMQVEEKIAQIRVILQRETNDVDSSVFSKIDIEEARQELESARSTCAELYEAAFYLEHLNELAGEVDMAESRLLAAIWANTQVEADKRAEAILEAERREQKMSEARPRLEARGAARNVAEDAEAQRAEEEARIHTEEAAARKLVEQECLQTELKDAEIEKTVEVEVPRHVKEGKAPEVLAEESPADVVVVEECTPAEPSASPVPEEDADEPVDVPSESADDMISCVVSDILETAAVQSQAGFDESGPVPEEDADKPVDVPSESADDMISCVVSDILETAAVQSEAGFDESGVDIPHSRQSRPLSTALAAKSLSIEALESELHDHLRKKEEEEARLAATEERKRVEAAEERRKLEEENIKLEAAVQADQKKLADAEKLAAAKLAEAKEAAERLLAEEKRLAEARLAEEQERLKKLEEQHVRLLEEKLAAAEKLAEAKLIEAKEAAERHLSAALRDAAELEEQNRKLAEAIEAAERELAEEKKQAALRAMQERFEQPRAELPTTIEEEKLRKQFGTLADEKAAAKRLAQEEEQRKIEEERRAVLSELERQRLEALEALAEERKLRAETIAAEVEVERQKAAAETERQKAEVETERQRAAEIERKLAETVAAELEIARQKAAAEVEVERQKAVEMERRLADMERKLAAADTNKVAAASVEKTTQEDDADEERKREEANKLASAAEERKIEETRKVEQENVELEAKKLAEEMRQREEGKMKLEAAAKDADDLEKQEKGAEEKLADDEMIKLEEGTQRMAAAAAKQVSSSTENDSAADSRESQDQKIEEVQEEPVQIEFVLDMDIADIENRTDEFKEELCHELCTALKARPGKMKVLGIQSGSIITRIEFQVGIAPEGMSIMDMVAEFIRQINDPKSALRQGKYGSRASSIKALDKDGIPLKGWGWSSAGDDRILTETAEGQHWTDVADAADDGLDRILKETAEGQHWKDLADAADDGLGDDGLGDDGVVIAPQRDSIMNKSSSSMPAPTLHIQLPGIHTFSELVGVYGQHVVDMHTLMPVTPRADRRSTALCRGTLLSISSDWSEAWEGTKVISDNLQEDSENTWLGNAMTDRTCYEHGDGPVGMGITDTTKSPTNANGICKRDPSTRTPKFQPPRTITAWADKEVMPMHKAKLAVRREMSIVVPEEPSDEEFFDEKRDWDGRIPAQWLPPKAPAFPPAEPLPPATRNPFTAVLPGLHPPMSPLTRKRSKMNPHAAHAASQVVVNEILSAEEQRELGEQLAMELGDQLDQLNKSNEVLSPEAQMELGEMLGEMLSAELGEENVGIEVSAVPVEDGEMQQGNVSIVHTNLNPSGSQLLLSELQRWKTPKKFIKQDIIPEPSLAGSGSFPQEEPDAAGGDFSNRLSWVPRLYARSGQLSKENSRDFLDEFQDDLFDDVSMSQPKELVLPTITPHAKISFKLGDDMKKKWKGYAAMSEHERHAKMKRQSALSMKRVLKKSNAH